MLVATAAGRLGADAETRTTQNGDTVANFSVAVNRPKKDGVEPPPLWVKASLFGKQAEALLPFLTKGKQVTVLGDIDLWTSQGRDNPQTVITMRVSKVTLQGDGPQNTRTATAQSAKSSVPRAQIPQEIADEDIPF